MSIALGLAFCHSPAIVPEQPDAYRPILPVVRVDVFEPENKLDSSREFTAITEQSTIKNSSEPPEEHANAGIRNWQNIGNRSIHGEHAPAEIRILDRELAPSGAVRSATALAALATSQAAGLPVCPPRASEQTCLESPAKGLYVWGSGAKFEEKQKEYDAGLSLYEHKGSIYSFGFIKDWTVNSSVGLSAEYVDSEVMAASPYDSRKNEVEAYIFNAHYQGTLWWRFPTEAKVFFGRADIKGDGEFGNALVFPWLEDKHKATLFGASGKVSFPLIFGDDIKVVPQIGLQYKRLKSESYAVDVRAIPGGFRIPKGDAKSLAIPLGVDFSKDYEQSWGVITPRLHAGVLAEFSDTARGVATFGAAAAGGVALDPLTRMPAALMADKSQKNFFRIGVGIDLLTHGGWDLRADYLGQWSDKYSHSQFKLELGRCF